MNWIYCDDEIKMGEFLDQIDDEDALRRFALELASSFDDQLEDPRVLTAIDVTRDFLNNMADEERLAAAYNAVEEFLEELEDQELQEEEEKEDENMTYEKALVVLWAAMPPNGMRDVSTLEVARQAALHAAFYSHRVRGRGELENQIYVMDDIGLPSRVSPKAGQ